MVKAKNMGRMGNFLFQTCTAIGYALDHGLEFTVESKTDNPKWNPIYCQHLVNPNWDDTKELITIREAQFHYYPLPFEESWRNKNILMIGYFQTEKRFKHHRDKIIELLNFHWQLNKGYVSVHVRRTDFIELNQKHPPVTKQWYEKAMAEFPNYKFRFFSDDIQWCMDNFGDRGDCEFSVGGNEEQDLVGISCCEHNICSASTFAWMGMWLNKNQDKKVIFPSLWFVEGWNNEDPKDIVPDWCIKIPNY